MCLVFLDYKIYHIDIYLSSVIRYTYKILLLLLSTAQIPLAVSLTSGIIS